MPIRYGKSTTSLRGEFEEKKLTRLTLTKVFSVTKTEDGLFVFTEACEDLGSFTCTKEEAIALLAEISDIIKNWN